MVTFGLDQAGSTTAENRSSVLNRSCMRVSMFQHAAILSVSRLIWTHQQNAKIVKHNPCFGPKSPRNGNFRPESGLISNKPQNRSSVPNPARS